MPGMVSERKLARLAAAQGQEFDGLFLDYMIGTTGVRSRWSAS